MSQGNPGFEDKNAICATVLSSTAKQHRAAPANSYAQLVQLVYKFKSLVTGFRAYPF